MEHRSSGGSFGRFVVPTFPDPAVPFRARRVKIVAEGLAGEGSAGPALVILTGSNARAG
jgi:hypothetical protein